MMNNKRIIVVTGIGVLTSIGCTRDDFWKALIAGKSGIKTIQAFDPTGHKSRIASEICSFTPENYMTRKQINRMARVSQLAVCAAIEAAKDAGLDLERENPARVGCVVGSGGGDYGNLEEQHAIFRERGPGSVSPLSIPKIIPNMPASNAAIILGFHGPNLGVAAACSTGAHSIGVALGILRQELADVMLAGGTESAITPFTLDSYSSMGVLSQRNDYPEKASRPFDADRDGMIIGEGAGVLVLETLEHAKQRNAEPLAILNGFGMTCDAYSIVFPEPEGEWAAAAMEEAIKDAKIDIEDIGYINAHGTSTRLNDKMECKAIKRVFASAAQRIPVSSNKSMIGHLQGAAGAVEAASTVLTVYHGIIPPTINFDTKDPDCDLDVVPNEARQARIKTAISNSFGFGGQNGVLVFSKV